MNMITEEFRPVLPEAEAGGEICETSDDSQSPEGGMVRRFQDNITCWVIRASLLSPFSAQEGGESLGGGSDEPSPPPPKRRRRLRRAV